MAALPIDITIPSWQNVGPVSERHTEFLFVVAYQGRRWSLPKRYSECLTLYEKIKKVNPNISEPFPSKPFLSIGTFEIAFIEKRRNDLERFFRNISKLIPTLQDALEFLGANNPNLENSEAYTRITFLPTVWPPAGVSALPIEIELNGIPTFVQGLVTEICNSLSYLQRLESSIFSSETLESRLEIVDKSAEQRTRTLVELESCMGTIHDLLGSNFPWMPQSASILQNLKVVHDNAVKWAATLEDTILGTIETKPIITGELKDKLPALNKQVEVSLALLVGAQSPTERDSAISTIKRLLAIIQTDLELAHLRNQTGSAAQLKSLIEYLEQALANHKEFVASVSEADVVDFEERMFAFIHEASLLDSHEGTEQQVATAATELLSQMDRLRGAMATARAKLDKNPDVSNTSFVNRIGDVQENLVEIQYQVKTKYIQPAYVPPTVRPANSANFDFEL